MRYRRANVAGGTYFFTVNLAEQKRTLHGLSTGYSHHLHHEPALIGPVLRIFLKTLEDRLKAASPGAPAKARFGAVTFVHRFGSALNANLPLLSAVEGAETEGERFHEATALTDEDIAAVQDEVRTRVLQLFRRRDLLSPDDAAAMRRWEHGGGFRSTPRSASRLATVRDSIACLRDKPFLLGAAPASIDAAAYATLANIIAPPIASPLKDYALSQENVIAYCERMRARYYGAV